MHSLGLIEQVSGALSSASLEHEVIVSNIANRDTEGYRRLQVSFDQVLSDVAPAGEPVSLEQDLLALSANAGRYQALAHSLRQYFSILGAITAYRS